MKLILDGRATTEAVKCMREGMWMREDVLERLKRSRHSALLGDHSLAADNALWATEKLMRNLETADCADFQTALAAQNEAFGHLEAVGWGSSRLLRERCRYEPHWVADSSGVYRYMFYNPATGQYDLSEDRGWSICGLPPRARVGAR